METNEFVAGVSYTCMIVITNVSPIQQVVEVMDPIPRGSYPLSTLKSLVNEVKTIDAFSTCTMSYSFVLSISRRWETLNIFQHTSSIQRRRPSSLLLLLHSFTTLHCVKEAKTLDVTSWKDVALNASEDVLLDSIRSHDVQELEWKEVCTEQTVQCFPAVQKQLELCLDATEYRFVHIGFPHPFGSAGSCSMLLMSWTLKGKIYLIFIGAEGTYQLHHGAAVRTGEFLPVNIFCFGKVVVFSPVCFLCRRSFLVDCLYLFKHQYHNNCRKFYP